MLGNKDSNRMNFSVYEDYSDNENENDSEKESEIESDNENEIMDSTHNSFGFQTEDLSILNNSSITIRDPLQQWQQPQPQSQPITTTSMNIQTSINISTIPTALNVSSIPTIPTHLQANTKIISKKTDIHCCYCLRSINPKYPQSTYIGYTTNPSRRIRQHNGIITCGANKTIRHRPWRMAIVVAGFPSKISGLQFEWMWQNPHHSRKFREYMKGKTISKGFSGALFVLSHLLRIPPWNIYPLHIIFATEDDKNILYRERFHQRFQNKYQTIQLFAPFSPFISSSIGNIESLTKKSVKEKSIRDIKVTEKKIRGKKEKELGEKEINAKTKTMILQEKVGKTDQSMRTTQDELYMDIETNTDNNIDMYTDTNIEADADANTEEMYEMHEEKYDINAEGEKKYPNRDKYNIINIYDDVDYTLGYEVNYEIDYEMDYEMVYDMKDPTNYEIDANSNNYNDGCVQNDDEDSVVDTATVNNITNMMDSINSIDSIDLINSSHPSHSNHQIDSLLSLSLPSSKRNRSQLGTSTITTMTTATTTGTTTTTTTSLEDPTITSFKSPCKSMIYTPTRLSLFNKQQNMKYHDQVTVGEDKTGIMPMLPMTIPMTTPMPTLISSELELASLPTTPKKQRITTNYQADKKTVVSFMLSPSKMIIISDSDSDFGSDEEEQEIEIDLVMGNGTEPDQENDEVGGKDKDEESDEEEEEGENNKQYSPESMNLNTNLQQKHLKNQLDVDKPSIWFDLNLDEDDQYLTLNERLIERMKQTEKPIVNIQDNSTNSATSSVKPPNLVTTPYHSAPLNNPNTSSLPLQCQLQEQYSCIPSFPHTFLSCYYCTASYHTTCLAKTIRSTCIDALELLLQNGASIYSIEEYREQMSRYFHQSTTSASDISTTNSKMKMTTKGMKGKGRRLQEDDINDKDAINIINTADIADPVDIADIASITHDKQLLCNFTNQIDIDHNIRNKIPLWGENNSGMIEITIGSTVFIIPRVQLPPDMGSIMPNSVSTPHPSTTIAMKTNNKVNNKINDKIHDKIHFSSSHDDILPKITPQCCNNLKISLLPTVGTCPNCHQVLFWTLLLRFGISNPNHQQYGAKCSYFHRFIDYRTFS